MSVVRRAVVITVSDRVTAGAREDVSGRVGADLLEEAGWQAARVTVSDDRAAIADSIESAVTGGAELVVTTGGTGVGPRDVTPEATGPLLRMQLPGIAEQIRDVGVQKLPQAMLSRGVAGICRQALVVNLAGSPGAVRDGIPVVLQVADHVIAQLSGGDHA